MYQSKWKDGSGVKTPVVGDSYDGGHSQGDCRRRLVRSDSRNRGLPSTVDGVPDLSVVTNPFGVQVSDVLLVY